MQTSANAVEVGVLGRVRAAVHGREVDLGGPRQQALLAALALQPGRTVANDVLIDVLWEGAPPSGAARTFRSYVAKLRRSFDRAGGDGAEIVLTDSGGYRLATNVEVDAQLFLAELTQARDSLAAGDLAAARTLTTRALGRWRGRALDLFADQEWARPTAVNLEESRVEAVKLRSRALLDDGRADEAVPLLEELAASEPLREEVARLRALALYRSGRDVDAIEVVRDFRSRLVEEHGLDPSDQLTELEVMILGRDPRLDRPVGGRGIRGLILHEPIAILPTGIVHRAEQPSIGRDVAVIVLASEVADDPEVVREFEARLQAVARVDHPHVLPIHDYWREPGVAYVVTRLPASTLDAARRSGRVTSADALRVGSQVGAALAAAHEQGVVHGMVDGDTIVVDERGDAFLWAFPADGGDRRPASDVAGLASVVTTLAGEGPEQATALPRTVAEALERAEGSSRTGAITAAALAMVLDEARAEPDGGLSETPAAGPNPYRGLAAFRESDADVYFGRDDLVTQVMGRLRRHRAVAVVGPSGCGKSSLVRAGVLPRLREGGAYVTTMVPGTKPLAELELALSRVSAVELAGASDEIAATPGGLSQLVRRLLPEPERELVLVIDQLEELFTQSEAVERDLFLEAIATSVADDTASLRVVLTLRSDFLSSALVHHLAGPLVRDRAVMVGPLDRDELHEVVVRPAEVAGIAVEPALALAVVADAARSPGSLPMVQFALTEVFAAGRDVGLMSVEAYQRIGGIEGVLGQRAEEVHALLDEAHQLAAHALFQRLVTVDTNAPPTRRRALRSELTRIPEQVIEQFGDARLLQFGNDARTREPTVEISHEALFHAWPRLATWIAEGRDDLRLLGHLGSAARDWADGGRDDGELYRGARLDAALELADSDRAPLSDIEADFLVASRRRRDRSAEADRLRLRRLRVLTAGLTAGLVLALIAGTFAWNASQKEALARQREEATARSAEIDELAFAASAVLDEDPERASLFAAHAYALEPDAESRSALLDVLDVEPRIAAIRPTPDDSCSERTGTGSEVLFTRVTVEGEVLELRTLEQDLLATFPLPPSPTFSCAGMLPSGDHLFLRHFDRYEVFDRDMQLVASRSDVLAPDDQKSMDFHPSRPEAALVLADGKVAVVSLPELRTKRVLDLQLGEGTGTSGEVVQGGPRQGGELLRAVAWSEDASLLAVADGATVHAVDDDGTVVASLGIEPHTSGRVFPFVSAGAQLIGQVGDRSVMLAPLDDTAAVEEIELGGATLPYRRGIAVEPGGRRAAVATEHGIQIVDLVDRARQGEPIPVDASIVDLFWTGQGELAGLGPNGVYQLLADRNLLLGAIVAEPPEGGFTTVVAPDGSGAIVFDPSVPTARYLSLDTGETLDLGGPVEAVAVTGGRWVAVDVGAGTASAGDARGVRSTVEVDRLSAGAWDLTRLEADAERATVLLRDVEAGDDDPDRSTIIVLDSTSVEVLDVVEPPSEVTWASARPMSQGRLLLADLEYRWRVLDRHGETLFSPRILGPGQEVSAAHPDGRFVTADWNGDLHVVDLEDDTIVDLIGPASFAMQVEFASHGRLVTRHIDGSTYLWDIAGGALIGRLWRSEGFQFFPFAVDREAGDVLQVTPHGVARIPMDPDAWFAAVCSRVDRELTVAELVAIAPRLEPGPGCAQGA